MLTFLILGAGIGFVAGVSPGPVLTLVVSETLRGGWPRGAAVAAGPLLADGPIVVVALTVLAQLPAGFLPAVSLVGGAFLGYLALTTAISAKHAAVPDRRPSVTLTRAGAGLLQGFLARALSPNPYLFWFLVGGPVLVQAAQQSGWNAAAFLVGYYATVVGSNVGLALVIHRWVGLLSNRAYRALLAASSLVLAVYGVVLVDRGMATVRSDSG
jgi:threonine/homoserine/homoserine lactone efflux protein